MQDNSVDLIVTDPPYGYSFMGKDWDKVVPHIDIWKQTLRVLKAGAFAFVMSAPRQDVQSRMINRLQDAGFNCGFTPLYWAYASGFPKASNISKMVDKRNQNLHLLKPFADYLKQCREKKGLSTTQVDEVLGTNTAIAWWEGRNYMGRFEIQVPTKKLYLQLKEMLDMDNRFDILIDRIEAEREVTGIKKKAELKDHVYFGDLGKAKEKGYTIGYGEFDIKDIPVTEQAKALDGSYGGFQPKPAVEIILVAMKPLSEKTYVEQALKNGKGITWLDDCRVPYESEEDQKEYDFNNDGMERSKKQEGDKLGLHNGGWKIKKRGNVDSSTEERKYGYKNCVEIGSPEGRFPANLIVSDDVLNNGINTGSKSIPIRKTDNSGGSGNVYTTTNDLKGNVVGIGDEGSFSRYYDLDKWYINKLPKAVKETFPFMIVPKASSGEKNEGLDGFEVVNNPADREEYKGTNANQFRPDGSERKPVMTKNIHPTVKPTELMSYLITLGSRENDLILDPFIGSGTTAIASRLLTRNFIGFEKNEEYHKIALGRIKQHMEQMKLTEVLT